MNQAPVRWGILGPGNIARKFFVAASDSKTGVVTALGTRNSSSSTLTGEFPGCTVHLGYETLLADPHVDAIYIATPHPFHAEWAIKAAERGKHVLCEKPMGMCEIEVSAMFTAAKSAGTFMAEAYMYRLHPLTIFILEQVKSGRIGQVRLIKSSFGFAAQDLHPKHRLIDKDLGGGAILDVGGYPISMASLIAGCGSAPRSHEGSELKAVGQFGEMGVELASYCVVRFENDILAELSCSITTQQDNVLHIIGSAGRLEIDNFWVGTGPRGGTATIRFFANDGEADAIAFREEANLYSFQFEAANQAIQAGRTCFEYPGMTATESITNATMLDRWLADIR